MIRLKNDGRDIDITYRTDVRCVSSQSCDLSCEEKLLLAVNI